MADCTDNRVKTRRSPESLPSGMVLFSISFCFSSGSAGRKERGTKGNKKKRKQLERHVKAVKYEKEARGRLEVPETDRKTEKNI